LAQTEKENGFEQDSHVGVRLLSYLLTFSFVISLAASSFVIYSDYQRGVSQFQKNLDQIHTSYQQSVSYSLWNFDNRQLESQLHGILNFPGVVYVYIENRDKLIQSAGDIYAQADQTYSFELTHESSAQHYPLGQLFINVNYTGLYDDLKYKAVTIIFTQFLKTFSVSIFILFLVRILITRRLATMASWANTFNLKNLDNPLNFNDNRHRNDELDLVANAINGMRKTLKSDAEERENARIQLLETKEQLTVAIDNAALGFARYFPEDDRFVCNNHFARHLATTQHELEALPRALEHIRDMIRGKSGPEQREKINQLLLGRISRQHSGFTMTNFRGERCHFDITLQIIHYSESRPKEILICLVDKTREQLASKKAQDLAVSLENKVTERTEQLYEEQQKAKDAVRKLEMRLARTTNIASNKTANTFKKLMLEEFNHNYPDGSLAPGKLESFREYLGYCLDDQRTAVDITDITNQVLQRSSVLRELDTITRLPFSLIISEPKNLITFLFRLLLENEPFIKQTQQLEIGGSVAGKCAEIYYAFQLHENAEAIVEHPFNSFCDYIVTTRFGGQMSRDLIAPDRLEIRFSITLETDTDEV
jgi:HAMP domain-containing protein